MRILIATLVACAGACLFGGGAQAQDRYARYGFDRPGYNQYWEETGVVAGVFMRRRTGAAAQKADYGAAIRFADGRAELRDPAIELRFNGPRPSEVWLAGERELRLLGVDSRGDGPSATSMATVGALLTAVVAVAANSSDDPCTDSGGFSTADGCVAFP